MICFCLCDFAQAPQMAFALTELSREERLEEIPGGLRANHATTQTDDVHMIVLDPLSRRKVIHYQSCACTVNFVCGDAHAHATPTHRDAALQVTCGHRPCEWD